MVLQFKTMSEPELKTLWNRYWEENPKTPTYKLRGNSYGRFGGQVSEVIVALHNNIPVGYASWTDFGKWFKVQGVRVAHDYQHKGIGAALMQRVTKVSNKIGIVNAGNGSSSLWGKNGWKIGNKPKELTEDEWMGLSRKSPVLILDNKKKKWESVLGR
tara:strand:+ start:4431 stop:4904 length:474 start_codon:yes stop_codon:yes gene_type:complete